MEHYLYENFSDLSASYEYSRLCCDGKLTSVRPRHTHAHPGEDIIWAQPAGRRAPVPGLGCMPSGTRPKHWYFVKGMPLIFFIHVVIACVIYRNFY